MTETLQRVGQQLDAGNFSDLAFTIAASEFRGDKQSTEDIAQKRRQLVHEWEELVERVRKLPNFKHFLRPIPFHQLRQVHMDGQVVIINASTYGVDALIFSASGPIKHVSLHNINLEALAELSGNIVPKQFTSASETQKQKYIDRFFKPTLRTIWDDILVDIFKNIHISPVETDLEVLPQR